MYMSMVSAADNRPTIEKLEAENTYLKSQVEKLAVQNEELARVDSGL